MQRGDAVLVGSITPELKRLLGSFERLIQVASLGEEPGQVVKGSDRGSRVLKLPPLLETSAQQNLRPDWIPLASSNDSENLSLIHI